MGNSAGYMHQNVCITSPWAETGREIGNSTGIKLSQIHLVK